jgi:hypothetical protein
MTRFSRLYMIVAVLCAVSCVTESKKTFIYSIVYVYENIVGFLGDSSIVVHQNIRRYDFYEVDKDTIADDRPVISVARIYDFHSKEFGDSAFVPASSSLIVRGTSLYYDSNRSLFRYDFASKRHFNTGIVGNSDNPSSISKDGEIHVTCQKGVSRIMNLKTGILLHSDSDGVGQAKPCTGYGIVGKNPEWHMYSSFQNPISYRTIRPTGVSPWIMTSDHFNGSYAVHDAGSVSYFQTQSGGRLNVPEYLDPEGKYAAAFNELRGLGILDAREVNIERRLYIYDNKLFSMNDSLPLYSARIASDTIPPG